MSQITKTLPTATITDTGSKSLAPISRTHVLHQHDHRAVTVYKECLKNHAASLNGNQVDGCMEFLSGITHFPADPSAILCAACGCHRNFHRKEEILLPPPPPAPQPSVVELRKQPPPPPSVPIVGNLSPPSSPSPPPISTSIHPSVPNMLLDLRNAITSTPAAFATPPPHTNITVTSIPAASYAAFTAVPTTPAVTTIPAVSNITSINDTTPSMLNRKRYRTKFTKLQKEKMLRFAEQSDWKIHKRNEEEIKVVCSDVGVDKNVLKVWLRNNKATLGKKYSASASATPITSTTTTSAAPKFRSHKKGIKIGGASSISEEYRGDRVV